MHDVVDNIPFQSNSPSDLPTSGTNKRSIIIAIVFCIALLFIIVLVILLNTKNSQKIIPDLPPRPLINNAPTGTHATESRSIPLATRPPQKITQDPDTPIMKVGNENIYTRQYEYISRTYPGDISSTSVKKIIMDKLVEDSLVLQGAQKDGIAEVKSELLNSKSSDLYERNSTVKTITTLIRNRADKVSGVIAAIWFLNERVGPLGYEKGKELAYKKITELHDLVKSGQLTMEGAVDRIKKDPEIVFLDNAYKANAYIKFDVPKNQSITISKEFDQIIWNMNQGEITDVSTIKDYQPDPSKPIPPLDKQTPETITKTYVDALYVFGQLRSKSVTGKVISYEDWLQKQRITFKIELFK
ncbi:MAG: hypothetical protein WCO06_03615 [Candidatus Roizmanbacteria bacterium]